MPPLRRPPVRARRRGVALLVALAALVLLGALAVALHAVTLRERRAARRATLARAVDDAAERALAEWRARLATDSGAVMVSADPPGTARTLATGQGGDSTRVEVTIVALAGGARLLVSEARASAGRERARRRVALVLVPDSTTVPPAEGDSTGTVTDSVSRWRRWLVPAPERPWIALP
jgi:hypothetical protein